MDETPGYERLPRPSLPVGQTGIASTPTEILNEFPEMVIDDVTKANLLNLRSRKTAAQANPEEERRMKQRIDQLAAQLKYDENCRVEIRFHDPDYDLIAKLQTDDLVDRQLTPQTRASIRIVLGTLAQFDETPSRQTP